MKYSLSLLYTLCCLIACNTYNSHQSVPSSVSNTLITTDISNQNISSFAEDGFGYIWMGTERGVNRYNGREFHQYLNNASDSTSLSDNQVRQVFVDSKKRIWVGTADGINLYTEQGTFRRVPLESGSQNVIQILENKDGRIFLNMMHALCMFNPQRKIFEVVIKNFDINNSMQNRVFMDNGNNLWAVTPTLIRCFDTTSFELKNTVTTPFPILYARMRNNGELWLVGTRSLAIYDTKNNTFLPIPAQCNNPQLSDAQINLLHDYSPQSILIGTERRGLFYYNFVEKLLIHQSESGFPFEAPNGRITALLTDMQKNLWMGLQAQGFEVRYHYKSLFNNDSYLHSHLQRKSVTSVKHDKQYNLWFTTLTDGVLLYDRNHKLITPINTNAFFDNPTSELNLVRSIFIDHSNAIWLLTYGGVTKCHFDGQRLQKVKQYALPIVLCINQDHEGTIWAGTYSEKIYRLREGAEQFELYSLFPRQFTFINAMLTLNDGRVVIAAFDHGLRLVNTQDDTAETIDMRPYLRQSKFIPTCLYEDSSGLLWIGTKSNGLFCYNLQTKTMKAMHGTACDEITAVQEDLQGSIWVSTLYGLSKYDRTVHNFTNYYKRDGIGGNQFNEKAVCLLPDNTIVFGGTHGLTSFNPVDIITNRHTRLLFEDLKINNQLVAPNHYQAIDSILTFRPHVRLQPNENSFSVSFIALDYGEYERVRYQYKMDNFDVDWMEPSNSHEAYYSNIPAGHYVFRVRATNNERTIVEAETSIQVSIYPAPWQSWWAYTIYTLVFLGITIQIIRMRRRALHDKALVQQAEWEKAQEKRVNQMNMSFFANVSHEFRTPLTMISGPVTTLCSNSEITGENKQLLFIIQRSVNRMLKLVNQMMDFHKLENDTLKLSVRRMDIISELKHVVEVFDVNAKNKGVTLTTHGLEDTFLTWLDADKLDKIMTNLVANALKFTNSGGTIDISFDLISRETALQRFSLTETDRSETYAMIAVTDSGIGIPEEQLEKVFERYYQLSDSRQGVYNFGTGIGLYYSRRLCELHHGYIRANNRIEGGTTFSFILPISEAVYSEKERQQIEDAQAVNFPLQTEAQLSPEKARKNGAEKKYKLLIVDDDTEVVHYLNTLLSAQYQVICRFDAESAYKLVEEEAPDIVLSDVVMPGTDGYTLCRRIKENPHLCHIPMILITAKSTPENQVEGLSIGADAYVTKPFNPTVLLALLHSLLSNREKIRSLLSASTQTASIEENLLSPQDNAFMTDLYHLMESELSNSELNISRMTEVMHISRTKLYYKVKGLTGENPNTFFKTYKLNRAAELLKEGKHNVSEIADLTGFSTLPHFSSSFKKQFGVAPTEYLKTIIH